MAGLNFRMTNIQATNGYAQLQNLNLFLKKKFNRKLYDKKLSILNNFFRQKIFKNSHKVEWLYTLILKIQSG